MATAAAKTGARKKQPGNSTSLRGRLQSWWGGGKSQKKKSAKRTGGPASRVQERPATASETASYWTPGRIELVQHIWGPGYASAGGQDYLCDIIAPLNVRDGMSVLDAAAGLGGAARYLAEEHVARVEGHEPSVELAAAGMRLSTEEDLASTASVRHYNPQTVEFRAGVYDLVIVRDLIRTVDDKATVLRNLQKSLKPDGTLLFTDLAYVHSGKSGNEIKTWIEQEPVRTRPWNKDDLTKTIDDLGLKILSLDDDTNRFKSMIVESWGAFRSTLATIDFEQEITKELIDEGNRWARYVEVLDGRKLRYFRITATHKG